MISGQAVPDKVIRSIAQFLILVGPNGCRHPASPRNQPRRRRLIDGHDWGCAEKSAERYEAAVFAVDGNYAHGGGLVVDDSYGGFVGYHCGDYVCGGVAGNCDHIESDGANGGHRFEFFKSKHAFLCGFDHSDILADGDKRAAESAYVR